jgi:hypothetical protein
MKKIQLVSLSLLAPFFFTSCTKEDPVAVLEQELITTITATFTPVGGGQNVVLTFRDLDGDGGNEPEITVSRNFNTNTTYNGSISFLNESVDPIEDITEEIQELGEEHQIFYTTTGDINEFTYSSDAANYDENDMPIGLQTVFTTSEFATGNLTITLRHEPNKSGLNVANGDITNANGSTDATVTFPITVLREIIALP